VSIDLLFEELNRPGSPGISVGLFHKGHGVCLRGYGSADLEHSAPISPDTVFHVASVSKQFTAFAIAMLARDGALALRDDIRKFLPFVPDFGRVITVQHLVHHTSGLRDQWSLLGLGGQDIDNRLRQQQVLNLVARQQALNFEPGSDHLYSNTGYTLLAEIVRVTSGRTLRQFTTERMFAPLGMTHTFFYDDISEVVPGRAHSYTKSKEGGWRRALLNYETVGATSLLTTSEDLLKWAANFSRPRVGDADLIREIGERGMLDDGTQINYAFGLMRSSHAGRNALLHFGGDAAFRALFAYFPADDFAVALLANHVVEDWDKLINGLVDLYLKPTEERANDYRPATISPSEALLNELPGCYLNDFEPAIRIERESESLYWTAAGGERRLVTFRADGTFDLGAGPRCWSYYRPCRDAPGRIVGFEDVAGRIPATTLPRRRIEPLSPTSAQLMELEGDYRSAELDITYTLAVDGRRLTARSVWSGQPVVFTPSSPDRFDAEPFWMNIIEIVRDARGSPKGLRVHGNRMRNVWFEKVLAS